MTGPTLSEFLLARLAEDEAAASAVPPLTHNYDMGGNRQDERFTFDRTLPSSADGMGNWSEHRGSPTTREHFARHDPARVLADCAAKRRIVEIHRMVKFTDVSIGLLDVDVCCICHGMLDVDGDLEHVVNVQQPFPCSTIRALAAIYADSPEFREEWR